MQDLVQSQYSSFNSRNSQYSSLFLNSAAAAAHRLPVKSEAPWGGAEYHHSAEFAPHPLSDRSYAGHPYSNMAAASGECTFKYLTSAESLYISLKTILSAFLF
jgi:hypothetical protein